MAVVVLVMSGASHCAASVVGHSLQMDEASGAVLTIREGTLLLGERAIPRIVFEASGPGIKSIAGVQTLVVPSTAAAFSVLYVNELEANETTVHIHGQTPPQNLDGVPYLSALPIRPKRSQYVAYPLVGNNLGANTGTYFAHGHFGYQHSLGLAMPVIVKGPPPAGYPLLAALDAAEDVVVFLEDVCPYFADDPSTNPTCTEPFEVYARLVDAWADEAASFNYSQCMEPATGTDVLYRYQTANSRLASDPAVVEAVPGGKLRLRFIAASGMTNYRIVLPPEVRETARAVAVDGQWILPLEPGSDGEFWLAVAQRLDVLIEAPQTPGAYPVFAQAESLEPGSLQSAITIVVGGPAHIPAPGVYSVTTSIPPGIMNFAQELRLQAYRLGGTDELPDFAQPDKLFRLELTGDNGFNSINRASYQLVPFAPLPYSANPNALVVDLGDKVCIDYVNFNADPHAMHLHMHSFMVVEIDGQPVNGAIRDTLLMARGGCHSARICFVADAPGPALLHCHMSFHLFAGMVTTVEYSSTARVAPSYTAPMGLVPRPAASTAPTSPASISRGEAAAIGLFAFLVCSILAGVCFLAARWWSRRVDSSPRWPHSSPAGSPLVAVRPLRRTGSTSSSHTSHTLTPDT
ncbi:multicopper oxidase [Thecamonas trahens ATCC 50062]|uniref:Multicopper oxidase n=1 Tax=Thecamonas trahens ATCC 50062 TaxID=461836 RepID=A0A0L0DQG0_THETB|nr:multicopper oxidase [Thecamonas trahens ATCC 50062]KNC53643.1 multicopper oxidase [Thecamonas trahens ATCC 50062]|eukprot:XP_013761960.1 multicopper oxidase [Thecamonas trahens ATCC 50062]